METLKSLTKNSKCACVASCLMDARNQVHVFHLQTTSYAQHVALNTLYEDIVGLLDRFVESAQGKYGIIRGYKSYITNYNESGNALEYIKAKVKELEKYREYFTDAPYLQQIVDDMIELFYSTIYKLETLK